MRRYLLAASLAALCAQTDALERCTLVFGESAESVCAPPVVIRWCSHKRQDWTRYRCVSDALRLYETERADFISDHPELPGARIWGVAVERAGPDGLRDVRRCADRLVRWIEEGEGKAQPRC